MKLFSIQFCGTKRVDKKMICCRVVRSVRKN